MNDEEKMRDRTARAYWVHETLRDAEKSTLPKRLSEEDKIHAQRIAELRNSFREASKLSAEAFERVAENLFVQNKAHEVLTRKAQRKALAANKRNSELELEIKALKERLEEYEPKPEKNDPVVLTYRDHAIRLSHVVECEVLRFAGMPIMFFVVTKKGWFPVNEPTLNQVIAEKGWK